MLCLRCGTPIKTPLEPMEYNDYLCNRCIFDDTLVIEIENREREYEDDDQMCMLQLGRIGY